MKFSMLPKVINPEGYVLCMVDMNLKQTFYMATALFITFSNFGLFENNSFWSDELKKKEMLMV